MFKNDLATMYQVAHTELKTGNKGRETGIRKGRSNTHKNQELVMHASLVISQYEARAIHLLVLFYLFLVANGKGRFVGIGLNGYIWKAISKRPSWGNIVLEKIYLAIKRLHKLDGS